MRICMLTWSHRPKDVRVFHKEAKSLQKGGNVVTIIAPRSEEVKSETVIDGVRIVPVPNYRISLLRILVLFHLFFEGLKIRVEVYHCHDPHSLLPAIFLKILTSRKIVYDVHEHWASQISESWFVPHFLKNTVQSLLNAGEGIICHFTDYTVTVSKSLQKRYQKLGKKTIILYNVPDLNLFNPEKTNKPLEKKYQDFKIVLHLGSMGEKRGLKKLLYALPQIRRKVPNAKFLQIGGIIGREEFKAWVKNYIEKNNLENHFEVVEKVPYENVASFINVSQICVKLGQLDNYNQLISLPNKLFEYMACEKPVVTNFSIEIKKIEETTDFGLLVDSKNPKEIAEAIIFLLKNPEEAERMGQNGRKAVEEKYNWERMEERLLGAYAELMNTEQGLTPRRNNHVIERVSAVSGVLSFLHYKKKS